MKTKHLFFITFLLAAAMLSNSFAQDNTKVGLPEGAIARLGKGGINLMRFSPDGTHLAVGTDVGVWLYDVPHGKETALFTEHPGQVNALAFSTDGKILASGGAANPVIQLWDLDTDSKLSTFRLAERQNVIKALAFSADDKRLISLDDIGEITHWDVDTGSKLSDINRVDLHGTAAFSEDGSTLAIGNIDIEGKIRLWDATTGRRRANLSGHASFWDALEFLPDWLRTPRERHVRALAFSPDGKMLASGSADKTVQLWNTEERSKHATFKGHKVWMTAVAFSADGKTVASGDAGKVIKLWDVNTRREGATLTGHASSINALTFAPEDTPIYGGCLASGSADGTIRFWDAKTGDELATFTAGHTEWVKAVAFAENGSTLASAAFNGTVKVWNLKTAQELTVFTKAADDLTAAVAFSYDAMHFASRGGSGTITFSGPGYNARGPGPGKIQLWDITTGEQISVPWRDVRDETNALAFSPDNKILVASVPWENILAWDINTGLELFRFNAAEPFPRKFGFSPNGTLFATNGTHVQTRVWDVTTQRDITPPNMKRASALAFSPDGTFLAYGHHQDGIVFWDITPTGVQERGRILNSRRGFGDVLTFSLDGKILLDSKKSADIQQYFIQLWDVDTGMDLGTLSGHTGKIEALVFSHDGKMFASGSRDGTVLLWDWEKISAKSAKIVRDNISKGFRTNLKPPQPPIEYAGKAEEAAAVINWLKKHNYQVKKRRNRYALIVNGRVKGSISGGGSVGLDNIHLKLNPGGIFHIRVQGIGAGTFIFDEVGALQFHSPSD